MNPEIFPILNANTAVKAVLGSNPLRFYPWGRAPQNVVKPYAVYNVYNGNPENYLDRVPDIDNKGTQIDLYAVTSETADSAFLAIRNALEPHGHMTSFATPVLDAETNLYTGRLEFDFWDER